METIKTKIAVFSKEKRISKPAYIAAVAVLILVFICCISNFMRANIQKKYSTAMQQFQEQEYQNLTAMTELFSRIDDPNVDVRYKLIPELKAQYSAASAVNSVLLSCDSAYALLSQEQIDAFDAAFTLYENAYQRGAATGLAKADMAACMEDVQALVTQHNTPVDPDAQEVVIINGSSGKIENSTAN